MALFYRKRPMSISALCSSPGRFAPESRNFPGDESSGVKHTGPGAEWARFPAPLTPFGEDFDTQDCHLQEWALDPSLPIVLVNRGDTAGN